MIEACLIGEIKLAAIGFDHANAWMLCDGRELLIERHPALYAVIETRYGGDGRKTFRIPDLRMRVPLGAGARGAYSYPLGSTGGSNEFVQAEVPLALPAHTHQATFVPDKLAPLKIAVNSVAPTTSAPAGNYLAPQSAGATQANGYNSSGTAASLGGITGVGAKGITTGSVTLKPAGTEGTLTTDIKADTRQPFLTLYYFICWSGEYPF